LRSSFSIWQYDYRHWWETLSVGDRELLTKLARRKRKTRAAEKHRVRGFVVYWPNARPERSQAVLHAIRLAESSATNGRVVDGLKQARVDVLKTAGAALNSVYGFPMMGEDVPVDGNAGTIASSVAKAAEKAVEAALAGPADSALAAIEAYRFAEEVARSAEATEILDDIKEDFAKLLRMAKRNQWTDQTPVPARTFDLLEDQDSGKPWWRFW
jgi:hypothetical protein